MQAPASKRLPLELTAVFLAPLARPEAMVVVPALIALRLWLFQSRADKRALNRVILAPTASFVLSLVVLTTFRILYFGYPLPNTYYAKVSPDLAYNLKIGYDYFSSFVTSSSLVGVGVLIVMVSLALFASELI